MPASLYTRATPRSLARRRADLYYGLNTEQGNLPFILHFFPTLQLFSAEPSCVGARTWRTPGQRRGTKLTPPCPTLQLTFMSWILYIHSWVTFSRFTAYYLLKFLLTIRTGLIMINNPSSMTQISKREEEPLSLLLNLNRCLILAILLLLRVKKVHGVSYAAPGGRGLLGGTCPHTKLARLGM